jgi:hypothetical protein
MTMIVKIETLSLNMIDSKEVADVTKHILKNGMDLKKGLYAWYNPFTGTMSKRSNKNAQYSAFLFKVCNN